MKKDEKFETILRMNVTPGQKVYMITMYYYKEPMTTKDFNLYLNKKLTFENLEDSFEDLMEQNIVIKTSKISGGIKRHAFSLNLEAIQDDNDEDEE